MTDFIKKIFFSTRFTAILFIVFATAMAFGTFIESWYSTETARIWVYNATWFEAIMVFFVINFSGNISRYKLWRKEKWPVLVLHLSWILIIVGAFITRYISYEGMMPIREGSTEKVFYSDKTYLTVFVDGEINGEAQRKILEDDLIVTPEALKSNLPWKSDFNGQEFTIGYEGFVSGAKEGLIANEDGTEYLKIVEAGDGNRHEHYIENGQVSNIHNVLFSLNRETEGAINIITSDSTYYINSPFEGSFMRMADQFSGSLVADSLQVLQLRSLYTVGGMRFVIPDRTIRGTYGIVKIPEEEVTEASQDALVLNITSNGETVRKELLGGQGTAQFSEGFDVGGLKFRMSYGSKVHTLPFSIKLNDFIAEKYPGTENGYASFMSKITVEDERPFDYDIYMNHVLDHKGYRFFQASFDPDEKGTVLSVNHDLWGTWITYIGYFLLYIGLMGIMFFGKTRFKDLSRSLDKLKKKKLSLTVLLIFGLLNSGVAQQSNGKEHVHDLTPSQEQLDSLLLQTTVSREHAESFSRLIIQDDGGRMKPINTFASELLRKLSFKNSYRDLTPDQVFLSMMLSPALWYNTEFIALDKKTENDSIRAIIGVPKDQRYVRATSFFDEKGRYKLAPYLQEAYATNSPNKFQKDFKEVDLRLGLLNRALGGEIIKIFPLLNDENNKWISAVEYRSGQYQVTDSLYANFIRNSVPYYLATVQNGINTGNYSEAEKLLEAFHKNQENHGSEVLPEKDKVRAEIIYNRLDIFNRLYKYYAICGLFMFLVLVLAIFKERRIWRIGTYFFKGLIVILFLWHTSGLSYEMVYFRPCSLE